MTNPEDKTISEIKAEPMPEKPEGYDEWCKTLTARRTPDNLGPEHYVIGYEAIMAAPSGKAIIEYCNYWFWEGKEDSAGDEYELLISRDAFCAIFDRIVRLEDKVGWNT